ncbi:hypothetical protein GAY31_19245 [Azospirillum brasilense]|nr:hypothetical protein [Azospirillum brasilense]
MHLHSNTLAAIAAVDTGSATATRVRSPLVAGVTLLPVSKHERATMIGLGVGAREITAEEAKDLLIAFVQSAIDDLNRLEKQIDAGLKGARRLIDTEAKPAAKKADGRTIDAVRRYIGDEIGHAGNLPKSAHDVECFRDVLDDYRADVPFDATLVDAALANFNKLKGQIETKRDTLVAMLTEVDALARCARDPNLIAGLRDEGKEMRLRALVTHDLLTEMDGLRGQIAAASSRIAEISAAIRGVL